MLVLADVELIVGIERRSELPVRLPVGDVEGLRAHIHAAVAVLEVGGLAVVVHAEGNAQQAFVAGVGVVEVQQRAVVLHLCRSARLAGGDSAARKCELLFVLTRPRQVSAVPVAHQAQRRLPHVELSGHVVVAHARQGDAL